MASVIHRLNGALPSGATFARASTAYCSTTQDESVIVEHAAGVARFAYEANFFGRGYLVEPQVANTASNPEDFSAWSKQVAGSDITVQANVATAPDGNETADRVQWNTANLITGVYEFDAGQTGDFAASVYVKAEQQPDRISLRNANGGSNFVSHQALPTWTRAKRKDSCVSGVTSLYIRRDDLAYGAALFWGAMRHPWSCGKYWEYHPGTKAADHLLLPATPLVAATGSVYLEWVPRHDAQDEINDTDTYLLDVDGTSFALIWRGSQNPSYLCLYNDAGTEVATFRTRHRKGDRIRIGIHWGGTPTRPWLTVNGLAKRGSAAWVSPTIPTNVAVGCTIAGASQTTGVLRDVTLSDTREACATRIAGLGDSISSEPYGSGDRCWMRRAASLRQDLDTTFLVAGVPSDTLTQMAARVANDVVDQRVSHCVVLGGVNDLVTARSLVQMQTDAATIYAALAAAGITVIACTILPFKGHAAWSSALETIRDNFNAWLLTVPTNVDAVVDTATALADPADTEQLLTAYNSTDNVHPSNAGSDALADSILTAFPIDPGGIVATSTHDPIITGGA